VLSSNQPHIGSEICGAALRLIKNISTRLRTSAFKAAAASSQCEIYLCENGGDSFFIASK
jgi:hypothetical protein